jgi:hypothetical protein
VVINSVKKLTSIIEVDLAKKSERRIRFINVERLDTWVKVKDIFASHSPNHVLLSKYCGDKDLTPKTLRLIADLKKVTTNTIVLPLSEHLRINNAIADQLLSNIVSLEHELDINENNFRIYFPMYRMKSRLHKIVQLDSRLENYVWFLDLEECDDDYTLTILPRTYKIKIEGNNLDGYREYLSYWEDNPCKPIILHTDNAVYYKDNVYNDNVIVLTTAYDILQYHKVLDLSVHEEYGDECDWDALLKKIENHTTLIGYLKKYFSMSVLNPDELIIRWNKQNNEFGKWLIWLWLKTDSCPVYLKHCIVKSNKWTELVINIVNSIFDYVPSSPDYWQIYSERKDLLRKFDIKILPKSFWDVWGIMSPSKGFYYLSDITQQEKEEIIRNNCEIQKLKDSDLILENIYPDVKAYTSSYSSSFAEIDEYFDFYRKQKLVNMYTDTFVQKVDVIGKEKGLWWKIGMKSRNSLVDEVYDANSYIFYVDALGAEFYWFIVYLLEKEHGSVFCDAKIAFAELPTITEYNKEFVANKNAEPRIPDLDRIKHEGTYPGYICAEFEIIRDVINRAISKLGVYGKIIITADHGASRGFVLAKGNTVKADNGIKGERDGRYCIDDRTAYESRLPCCLDIDKYHVFANYDRFSVSGATKNENHGGASLEEVLVPVIVLSIQPFKEKVSIVDYDRSIKPINGKGHVTFKLDKEVDTVVAVVLGQRYTCFKENDRWYFDANIEMRAEYTAQILHNGVIGEFKYLVQKGIKSKQDF